jgi:hypothetical protein
MFLVIPSLEKILEERVCYSFGFFDCEPLAGLRGHLGTLLNDCVNAFPGHKEGSPMVCECLEILGGAQFCVSPAGATQSTFGNSDRLRVHT